MLEVEGFFSFPSIIEYTRGRGSFGGVIPVGAPGHVAPGTRRWRRALIGGGFEVFFAIENCYGIRRKKEAILRGEVVFDIDTHRGERSSGGPRNLIWGDDGGVPGLAAFCFLPGGPLNVSVFYQEIIARSSSPMACLVKMLVFQCHHTSLLLVADVVGDGAVVVPVSSKRSAILTGVPLWLPGKLFKTGW